MAESFERLRVYEVSRRVGEILHYIWDPIGIAGVPQARDEYDGYVGGVTGMLMMGTHGNELAAHLHNIEVESMCLMDTPAARAHDLKVANLLLEHFAVVDAQYQKQKKG